MNFRYRLMQFLNGRYGVDETFYVLFAIAAVLSAVNLFLRPFRIAFFVVQFIVYLTVILALFRMFSRNHEARRAENRVVRRLTDALRRRSELARRRKADWSHVYKKCPGCRAILRLPKRKGKHSTVCPKCGKKFNVRVR